MPSSPRSDAAVTLEIKTEAAQAAEATPGQPPELSSQKPKYEFWLVAHIQDCKVVTAQETASAKCFLKFHWQDKDFLDKVRGEKRFFLNGEKAEQTKDLDLEKLAVDLEDGEMVYGMVDAAPDSFPLNIDEIFLNQITAERMASLCWTMFNKNTVQIVNHVTVRVPMQLERYPYDRHVVPFCLGTRALMKDADGTKRKWELCKEWPDWAPSKFSEDKKLLLASQTTPDLEYDHKRCFVYHGKKPILCLLIERAPKNVLKRVGVPVCIVSSLPTLPYLTLADCYFLLGFFIHLLIVFKVIIASQECIDTSDHLNRTYLGGTVCQERNHGMTIFLAACWLLLHAALFLDLLFPIFTNCVRVSYKKLIEEYAEKFFSKPVTCTMDEDINKLESRNEREMKGDIYKKEKRVAAAAPAHPAHQSSPS